MFHQFRENGRLPAVDLMKLYASFLVILSHCISRCVTDFESPLYNAIWLTQMPLFFFASGLVSPRQEKLDGLGKFLLRTLKNALTLLFPCLTFLLLSCALSSASVLTAFRLFYEDPQNGLWFLFVLFFVHLVFDFGTYLSTKMGFRGSSILVPILFSAVCCLFALLLPRLAGFSPRILGLKLFAYYIPYYVFGFLARCFLSSAAFSSRKPAVLWAIFGASLAIVLFEVFYFPSIPAFDDGDILFLAIRVLGSTASILVHLFLTDILTSNGKLGRFASLGSYSLQSYYLHILFLRTLPFSASGAAMQWLLSFGTAILLAVMVGVACLILHFIPFANLVLFGKSRSFYAFERRLPKILR